MTFCDINCGYFMNRRPGQYAGTFDEVRAVCDKNGITRRAWYNMERGGISVKDANAATLAHCRGTADTPVLRLLPPAYSFEAYTKPELEKIIAEEKPLFRVWPKQDASPLTDWMFGWMLPLLAETGSPVLLALEEADLGGLAALKAQYPGLPVVLTNTTQWMNRQYLRFVQSFEKVYLDTSNVIEYGGLENIVGILGAEKLLFGTYMPEKEPYDKIFQLLHNSLSDDEKALVAEGNYHRLVERGAAQ